MWRALVKGLDSADITYCDTFPPANSIESAVRRICSVETDVNRKLEKRLVFRHQMVPRGTNDSPDVPPNIENASLCGATWASWHVQGDALHLSDNISSWLHCGAQMAASARWNGALPVIPVENVFSWCDRIKAIGWLCLACYVIVVSQDSLQWLMKRSIWAKKNKINTLTKKPETIAWAQIWEWCLLDTI